VLHKGHLTSSLVNGKISVENKTYLFITIGIKATSEYNIVNLLYERRSLLHVSATFCGHLEVCVVPRICYKDLTSNV
jgi:hypothetical protein